MASSSRLVVVVCVGLLLLAGCSTGLDQSPSTPAPEPSETPTSVTNPASTAPSPTTTNGSLAVHYINVGQSVSTLLIGPTGETMLIDTGHFTDDGEYVLQYLQQHDIDRIDYLITSHNDADHIGGNAALIEYYETEADGIGAVYDPGIAASTQTYEAYLDAIEAHDVTLYETREGDRIPFEGVDIQVLGPPEPYLANEARNENSIVLHVGYGDTSFLFTGDAEDDQEAYLVETYGEQLRSAVLKAGHHGSDSSTGGELLGAVNPAAVVISSAYDSQYGHPHQAVLDRLAARDITTYWTATHGNSVFISNGTHITVATQRGAPTSPAALREGEPVAPGTTDPVVQRAVITGTSGVQQTAPVATDGGQTTTPSTTGSLSVVEIHADASGDDRANLNDEYVVFRNDGEESLDLSGWRVRDDAGHEYTFPDGVTLAPGARVTLHTGSGADTTTDLYWGSGRPIWNNDGDTVSITNSAGDEITRRSYS